MIGVAANAAAFWYAARLLGPAGLGPIVAWISALAVAQTLLDLGMATYSIRELARDPGWSTFATFRRVRAVVSLAVLCLAAVVATRGQLLGLTGTAAACLIAYLAAHCFGDLRMCPAMAAGRQPTVGAWQATERVVALAVLAGAGGLGLRQAALPVGMLAGAGVYVLGATTVARAVRSAGAGPARGQVVRRCGHFLLTSVGSQVQNLDVAVVSAVAGPAQAGFYGVPSRITNPLVLVVSSYCSVLYPAVARDPTRQRLHRTLHQIRWLGIAAGLVYGSAAALAGPLIRLVLGPDYLGAVGATRVILVAMIALTVTMPIGALLQALGRERTVARTIAVTSLIGIPVTALGASVAGASGAAAGWLTGQLAVLVQFAIEVCRLTRSGTTRPAEDSSEGEPAGAAVAPAVVGGGAVLGLPADPP